VNCAGLSSREQIQVAIAVDVGNIEARIHKRADIDQLWLGKALTAAAIEPAAVVAADECVQAIPVVAVPAADESDRREPTSGLRAARQQSTGCRPQRPRAFEGEPTSVAVVDDLPGIRSVTETWKAILIAVAINIIEGQRHPASIVAATGQLEKRSARSKSAAFDEAIPANILVAVNERPDAPFKKVRITVVIQVGKSVEVTRGDFAATEFFTEKVAITDEA